MKPRTITPSKILAVALGAASGCTPPPAPAPAPAADVIIAPEPRATAAEAPPPSEDATRAGAPAPPEAAAEARRAPPEPAAPALVALREELLDQDRDQALAAATRFRPLCDADGYPLVGNVMRKSGPLYQPSAFCSDVRARARR